MSHVSSNLTISWSESIEVRKSALRSHNKAVIAFNFKKFSLVVVLSLFLTFFRHKMSPKSINNERTMKETKQVTMKIVFTIFFF